MERIKAFFYNNQFNYIIVVALIVVDLICCLFVNDKEILLISVFIALYFFINLFFNKIRSHNSKYFRYGYPLFYKKVVWINQRMHLKKDQNECPKFEFIKDMKTMIKDIPEETTCYCCTHELIKKHIVKKYPDAEVTEAYIKDIKKLKKKMRVKKCQQCSNRNCNLLTSDKTQFYSIKFVKK